MREHKSPANGDWRLANKKFAPFAIRQPSDDATVMPLHQSGRNSFTFPPIGLITLLVQLNQTAAGDFS
jgi:hypothetical protein